MATVIQFCNRCEERKYLKLCRKCFQYLCAECKKEHFCGITNETTAYPSNEHLLKQPDNKPFQCQKHLKEVIRLCFTCTTQLCEECLDLELSEHKDHVIYNVKNAAKEIRRQTEQKIATIKAQIEAARKRRHELDKHRFSSQDRSNNRRQVMNLASNLASAIVAAIEDQKRLDKTVVAESVGKLQKSIDLWTDINRNLHKISMAPNDLENVHLFCKYIKIHENHEFPAIRTMAEFPDDRKFQHSELIQKELRDLMYFLAESTGINIPLPMKTEEEIERLATAYDRETMEYDLATNPASRVPSRASNKTAISTITKISKIEEDSFKYIKSENQALKMEISKLHKQTKEMIHATSLLTNYCSNAMKFTIMQETDILDALKSPLIEDDELMGFYENISTIGQCFADLKAKILNEEVAGDEYIDHFPNHTDDTKSIQTRLTIDTVGDTTLYNAFGTVERSKLHSPADTLSTTIHDKVSQLPPISQRSSKPNNLVYMYNRMYDNEWTDALETLTQSGKRWAIDLVIKHLYVVMKACFKICLRIESQQLQDLIDVLFLSRGGRTLPLTDIKPVMDLRRKHAVDTAVNIKRNIYKMDDFQSELNKFPLKSGKLFKQIYDTPFFGKCIFLCWSMVLEEPKLCLFIKDPPKGSVIDMDLFREYTKGGKRILYCVWPPLLLKEDGEILVKGIVQTQ